MTWYVNEIKNEAWHINNIQLVYDIANLEYLETAFKLDLAVRYPSLQSGRMGEGEDFKGEYD